MKYNLLFLFVFCAFSALKAQNPPCQAYAGPTSWSSNGEVTITAYDSSAFPVSAYLWNTGETTEEIIVTTPGDYCVTITYEDGCTASDCYELSDTCYVWAWWYWVDSTTMHLIADVQPNYLGNETYLWSTGETTSSIYTSTPGTYCVTITKDYGCTATACVDAGAPPPPPCQLYFWEVPDSSDNGGVFLNTSLDADGTPAYLWDNGATTPSIYITEPGTYCVTATNGAGCTKSHCFEINCKVYVEQNPAGLTANPAIGTPPYTFIWSTGETTPSIAPDIAGVYWVTVTDANGCTSKNYGYFQLICNAFITYNSDNTLTAEMTGDGPFVYAWSPGGYTTQTIAPTEAGYYYVTVTNANGCEAWTYEYWYDPNDCEVMLGIYTDSMPVPNTVWISAQPGGLWGDWEFEWSTGSTDNQITVSMGGEYCVTATNTFTGCTSVNCTWVQPDSACYVQINSTSLDPSTLELSADGGPDPLVTYAWSTGETTPVIEVTEGGQYGVTVTNSAGCTVSGYRWIYESNSLVVHVNLDNGDTSAIGNNGVHADIYLIEYDPAQGGILTAIDTVATYSWTNTWALAQLQDVPPGQYLVKAALQTGSNGYDDYLPTYYDGELLWSAATPVTVHAISSNYSAIPNIQINLVPGQNPGGPGFIGGLVSQGANLTGSGDHAESLGEGDPFPGANVVLTLPDGTPVAATVTDANGAYSFNNLAWGTYTLTLDIPGLTPVSIAVTIGPGQQSVTNANFKVDENSISLPVKETEPEISVRVFPNPARDFLTVEIPAPAELILANTQGQTVLHTQESDRQARLSLNNLPAGMYFLTVRMASGSQILKVMIE